MSRFGTQSDRQSRAQTIGHLATKSASIKGQMKKERARNAGMMLKNAEDEDENTLA